MTDTRLGGGIGRTTAIALPSVGDSRSGVEMRYRGKDTPGPFIGVHRTVVVLDGKVLPAVTYQESDYPVGEPWQPEPQIDATELGDIVASMAEKLG